MATGRITKSTVDALRAVGGKPAFLWDNELRGLGVKATPAGRKVYLVQYRLGGRGGRAQRVTLGTHGNITADEARQKAKQVLGEIADGIDVAAEILSERGQTFQKPCDNVTAVPARSRIAKSFVDITDAVGLDFQHIAGPLGSYYMPEVNGTGGASLTMIPTAIWISI